MQNSSQPDGRRRDRFGLRRCPAVIASVGVAVALAACGSSSPKSSSAAPAASGTSTPVAASPTSSSAGSSTVATATAALSKWSAPVTTIGVTTPLKSTPPAGKTLVMLATSDPSNVLLQKSLAKLAALVHWNYSQVSYDPANPATFNAAVDTAITKHANYIAEAGIPLTPAVIAKVKAAGAMWVLTAVYPVSLTSPVLVDTDSYANDEIMGKIMADYFVSNSAGKGDAVIEHVPAYPILDAFTNTFISQVKSICPACKTTLVNVSIPDLVAGKLASDIVSAVQSDSSANYVAFDDGPFAAGVPSALASAGLSSRVKIIGEAADQTAIAELKAGKNAAWTGFDPVYSTYQMMDAMLRNAEGMPVSTAEEQVQPTQLLTQSNVSGITNWSQPTNALAQFEKLWNVS
jgi:ribose transport system substrate-binding protein